MAYRINARLEQGTPSLTLIDASTGEERFHWRGNSSNAHDWQKLFQQLVLLSCADQLGLSQRSTSPQFGEECLRCTECIDQRAALRVDKHRLAKAHDCNVVSLQAWREKD